MSCSALEQIHAIAVAGDISKIYHIMSIPLAEQHVHRFIWQDCEI